MLAFLADIGAIERGPAGNHKEYLSEGSDVYTAYNSPASSCFDDHTANVAAEVEIDLSDNEEFYQEDLENLEIDLKSSGPLPWTYLADRGDTITEFTLNEFGNRHTEGEASQSESICSDGYWNRCNSWVKSTIAEVEKKSENAKYRQKSEPKAKRKCNCKTRRSLEKLSWNEMTASQQRETIEHLTEVISSTMGLREQLDVIRILNPKAVVSATDTEFEIDLELLNCDKLDRIRKYVKEHQIQTGIEGEVKSSKNNNPGLLKKTKRKSGVLLHHRRKVKADKKQNALLSRVYKQLLKEKRSGLFHNEQVISISQTDLQQSTQRNDGEEDDDEDDIEIDILH